MYLDKIHEGPGVFSISIQPTTANILFMKNFFKKTELQTNLKTRFIEARRAVKSDYPQEINWNGYRLYTNTILEDYFLLSQIQRYQFHFLIAVIVF